MKDTVFIRERQSGLPYQEITAMLVDDSCEEFAGEVYDDGYSELIYFPDRKALEELVDGDNGLTKLIPGRWERRDL